MADHCHASDGHVAEYRAPEPSIPASHDSLELTDNTVVIYDRDDSERWIWADGVVQRTELR